MNQGWIRFLGIDRQHTINDLKRQVVFWKYRAESAEADEKKLKEEVEKLKVIIRSQEESLNG